METENIKTKEEQHEKELWIKYKTTGDKYCENQQEIGEESSYLYYTNLREDEQLDDLTLVAVRM